MLAADFHVASFERRFADQLSDAGLDAIEAAEDEHGTIHAGGAPAGDGFEIGENGIEPGSQVGDDVIRIARLPVARIHGGSGAADEDGAGHQSLKSGGGGEHLIPRWQ